MELWVLCLPYANRITYKQGASCNEFVTLHNPFPQHMGKGKGEPGVYKQVPGPNGGGWQAAGGSSSRAGEINGTIVPYPAPLPGPNLLTWINMDMSQQYCWCRSNLAHVAARADLGAKGKMSPCTEGTSSN